MQNDERPLWRDRRFGTFWIAQFLSVAGDSFSLVALPLLVLAATGSVARMGLLTALATAATVVTGLAAGPVVDRVDRRRLLIGCDLARAGLYAAVPLVWLVGPQVWLLYLIVPLAAAVGMFFRVGYVTVVPGLVGTARVTEANGLLSATYAVAGIVGPVLAGAVCALIGPSAAIGVDAASFAVSAAGLALVRLDLSRPEETTPADGWRDLLVGARFLWRQPVLRTLTVLLSLLIFLTLGLTDLVVYRLKHDLGTPDGTVGLVLAVAAGGTALGATLVRRVRRGLGFGGAWISGHVVSGLAIVGIGVVAHPAAVTALLAVYSLFLTVSAICSLSLRQEITPNQLLGRVTAAFWTIHFALGPLGATLLTWAAGRYGTSPVLVTAGAGCVLVTLAGLFTPVRQRQPESLVHGFSTGGNSPAPAGARHETA